MTDKPLMDCKELAAVFGVRVSTIWKRIENRTMFPAPVSWQRPYRFSRVEVQRVINGELKQPIHPRPNRRGFFRRGAEARARLVS